MPIHIGIHDTEGDNIKKKTFPNYALMKISAFHKSQGHTVSWWNPIEQYDITYSSKVFGFMPDNPHLPESAILGGTGYGDRQSFKELPTDIERMFPDYSIYPDYNYAIGYLTRGCPNHCNWCVVPEKEGDIRPYRHWQELVRPDSNQLVLMDNNILASEHGISELESLIGSGYAIDMNQGMDARLFDERIAAVAARLKWIRYIRFSCDTLAQVSEINRTADLLARYGVKPYRLFIYLLVTKDLANAVERVEGLKHHKGITIYAQAERNEHKGIVPNKAQLEFARYVYSGIFRTVTWWEYCKTRKLSTELL